MRTVPRSRWWAQLFGQGLVHPVDMQHVDNPPSHPELYQLISRGLLESDMQPRRFLAQLVQTDAGGVLWRVVCLPDATTMAVSGGSSGGLLLFFTADQEKDIHLFAQPSLARDMDLHAASERVVTVHHDQHVRITHLFAG